MKFAFLVLKVSAECKLDIHQVVLCIYTYIFEKSKFEGQNRKTKIMGKIK